MGVKISNTLVVRHIQYSQSFPTSKLVAIIKSCFVYLFIYCVIVVLRTTESPIYLRVLYVLLSGKLYPVCATFMEN